MPQKASSIIVTKFLKKYNILQIKKGTLEPLMCVRSRVETEKNQIKKGIIQN